jgi:ABC-2 type transport system permease protein
MRNREKEIDIENKKTIKETFASRPTKAGGFSLIITAILLAIIIILNIVVSKLPSKYKSFDLSRSNAFTIGDESKGILNKLEKDVALYYLCEDGQEDLKVLSTLESYRDSSSRITLKTIDPIKNPKFASAYTESNVASGSIIAVCGDRSKVVNMQDLYDYDFDTQTYSYVQTGFKAENAITNAIAYVVSDYVPRVSYLTGHGEKEVPATYDSALKTANFETATMNLSTTGTVPEDTEAVAIISPKTDLNAEETKVLSNYITGGGKLFVATDNVTEKKFPNLCTLLAIMGVKPVEGTLVETDADHYFAYMDQTAIIPVMSDAEITSEFGNYLVLFPDSQGFLLVDDLSENVSVTPFLQTTSEAFSAVNIADRETLEYQEGDIKKDLGFGIGAQIYCNDGKAVYYSSSTFIDDETNNYTSDTDLMLFVKSFGWLCDVRDSVSIPSKSFNYEPFTITDSGATLYRTLFVFVVPGILLLAGIAVIIIRKKR